MKDFSWKDFLLGVFLVCLVGFLLGYFPTLNKALAANTAAEEANGTTEGDLWSPVKTSANSNGNFIGDFGGKGNGTVIPSQVKDLKGTTWDVGRALATYCEDASTCYYMVLSSGQTIPRAFNLNLYTPEFLGDLSLELVYVDTGWNNNSDVTWEYYK
jgi:hypothetical protein